MSELSPEVKKAIAEAQSRILDTPRDLSELIAAEKKKADETPVDKKEEKEEVKEPEKKSKKQISKEDASNVTDLLGTQLGFRADKRVEEAAAAEKAKKEKEAKDAEEKAKVDAEAAKVAEEKAKKESKKVNVTKQVAPVDPSVIAAEVAAKTAKEIASAMEKSSKKKEKDEEDDLGVDLSEEEKADVEVFKEMSKSDQYKDLPKKYVASIKKIDSYKTKWEKENPDKEFNPDDEEHDEFYAKVTPSFSDKDYRRAEIQRAASDMLKEQKKETEIEQASIKTELATKELEPVIQNHKIESAAKVLEIINPDYLKMISEDKDGFNKFQEKDPVAAQALMISAQRLGPFIEAARQLDDPKGRFKIDEKNAAHVEYVNYLIAKEDEMKRKPAKEQVNDNGQRFVTRQEFIKLPDSERKRVWFYKDTDLINLRAEEEGEFAKQLVQKENERVDKLAKIRGWKIDSETKGSQKDEEVKKKEDNSDASKKAKDDKKVESPSAGGGGKVDGEAGGDKKVDTDFLDKSASILFRR